MTQATTRVVDLAAMGRPGMIQRTVTIVILLSLCATTADMRADAIVKTQAMRAATIAEFYIESRGVRVDLEIGRCRHGRVRRSASG